MLLTIACFRPSALARLPVDFIDNRLILWLVDALVLTCVGIDSWRKHRLHPAFGWGAALVLGVRHPHIHIGAYRGRESPRRGRGKATALRTLITLR